MRNVCPAFFVLLSLVLQFIPPLIQGERPVLFHQFYRLRFVLVFVFLVTFLFVDVSFDVGTSVFKAWNLQFLVDFLRHVKCIGFVVFKADFYQVAFRNKLLVGFILVVQFGINRKDVLLQFFVADVLQFQRLNGVGEEAAC